MPSLLALPFSVTCVLLSNKKRGAIPPFSYFMISQTLVSNTCYSTVADADTAFYSSKLPITFQNATSTITVEYVQLAGVWNIRKTTVSAAGVTTVNYTKPVTAPVFPSCDTLQGFNDGLLISSGLTLACVTAVIFGIIARAR